MKTTINLSSLTLNQPFEKKKIYENGIFLLFFYATASLPSFIAKGRLPTIHPEASFLTNFDPHLYISMR